MGRAAKHPTTGKVQLSSWYDPDDIAEIDAILAALKARDGKAGRWTRTQVLKRAAYLGLDILREQHLENPTSS